VTRRVITAVGGAHEASLVAALATTAGYAVARRCADLPDLISAAAAGVGDVALVSADLRALDRSALAELAAHGVRTAGVTTPGDDAGERRLRQLGLSVVLSADLTAPELDDGLDQLEAGPDAVLPGPSGDLLDDPGRPDPGATPGEVGESRPRAEVVAVWGPAGAPGRSTLALNLAAELAQVAPTLLVDCDTYGASVAQSLGLLDEAPGMAAAARSADQGSLDLTGLARLAPEVSTQLRVLTGLPRADRWTELRAASVVHVLTLARELARYVVVDCCFSVEDDEELSYDTVAPRRNAATLSALEVADRLLVVGAADPVGLQRLVRAVQDLDQVTAPEPHVVVNKVRASAVGPHPEQRIAEALGRFAGMQDLSFVPWDPATLDGAMLAGATLVEVAPQSPIRRSIAELARRRAGVGHEVSSRGRRRRGGLRS
jgi:Flp pilus assembly CpaE family ATPase